MVSRVRKAVFPVAGLGTRFLPATKAIPKEMLTVVDKPVIQHVYEEARSAGIEHFIFVTGRNKGAIEDHFDIQYELQKTLADRGKTAAIEILSHALPAPGETSFTRQQSPLGLGHAVWCAREIVGNEPFAVLLPDMLHAGSEPCLKGMIKLHEETGGNVIGLIEVPEHETQLYGIADIDQSQNNKIRGMIEKPKAGSAPSQLAISGRYILSPKIFDILEHQPRGQGGEIQLTDAMASLMQDEDFFGHVFHGDVYDTGHVLGFLKANIAYALKREDIAQDLRQTLKDWLG